MNKITIYNHEMFGEIRITDREGEPWFIAKDVAEALGYKDTDQAVRRHCKDVRTIKLNTPLKRRGNPNVAIIQEPDVYALVFGSNLPAAEEFKRWVFREVLPAIRKTGRYELPERELRALRLRKQEAGLLIKTYFDHGIVGRTYLDRYIAHAVASIEGREFDGVRTLDVSSFLEGKGLSQAVVKAKRSEFGKRLKKRYFSKVGEDPSVGLRDINGADRPVRCYELKYLSLFEEVYKEMFQ
jgi:prophage antirepressor-like protein